jgi:hypothetical protein
MNYAMSSENFMLGSTLWYNRSSPAATMIS